MISSWPILIMILANPGSSLLVRTSGSHPVAEQATIEGLGGPFYRVSRDQLDTLQEDLRWVVPDVRRRILLDATPDPTESLQWHLFNDGSLTDLWPLIQPGVEIGAGPAWAITEGSSEIVIAVLDGGIPSDHPDLPSGKQLPGWDFVDGDADPSPIDDGTLSAHGTAVAGVALAARNGTGIVGVCPGCRLLPVRMLAADATARDGDIVAALAWAAERADVINASWSFDRFAYVSPAVHEAIRWAATEGRNGKGCVIIFSAGNRGTGIEAFAPQAMIETLVVGATDETDLRASYSNSGQALTIMAPGGLADEYQDGERLARAKIVTADLVGEAGNNPNRDAILAPNIASDPATTAAFWGTSASAPQVAGAVGLLLSLRPELTAREVTWILEETAVEIGQVAYNVDGRNELYGFGRLDVAAALRMARDGGHCIESQEICDNGLDDDCDRRIDERDPSCGGPTVRAFEVPLGKVCSSSNECGDGYCAQPEGRLEIRRCTADCDFDCPADGFCFGPEGYGRCRPSCRRQSDCPGGTWCEFPDAALSPPGQPATAVCLPRCDDDRDCNNSTCRDGLCAGGARVKQTQRMLPERGCGCSNVGGAASPMLLLLRRRRRR